MDDDLERLAETLALHASNGKRGRSSRRMSGYRWTFEASRGGIGAMVSRGPGGSSKTNARAIAETASPEIGESSNGDEEEDDEAPVVGTSKDPTIQRRPESLVASDQP